MPGWNIQVANIAGPHNGAVSGATAVQTKKHEQHRKPIAAAGFAGAPARFVEAAGGTKKKGPLERFAQGAVSHGRPVLTGRNGESAAARRSGA